MNFRWFLSPTVRQTADMCKQVQKLLNAQRDILEPAAVDALEVVVSETRQAIKNGASDEELRRKMTEMEEVAGKRIKPYPHPDWRENYRARDRRSHAQGRYRQMLWG